MNHLTNETLDMLVEGELPSDRRAHAKAHLSECGRCAAALEAHRALFGALQALPRMAPGAGFPEAVMARVRIATAPNPVWAWLRSRLPQTRRGWGWATAALSTPAVVAMLGLLWVLTLPALTPGAIGRWAWVWVSETAAYLATGLLTGGARVLSAAVIAAEATVLTGPLLPVLLMVALSTPVAAWSLVYLLRTPQVERVHAH